MLYLIKKLIRTSQQTHNDRLWKSTNLQSDDEPMNSRKKDVEQMEI